MNTYTVKITEVYYIYGVEADSREGAISKTEVPLDNHDCGDYELYFEAEEEDEFN